MDAPTYQAPPPDPQIAILQQQAQQQDVMAAQQGAQVDSAQLAMLYGTQSALGVNPDIRSIMTNSGAAPMKAAI